MRPLDGCAEFDADPRNVDKAREPAEYHAVKRERDPDPPVVGVDGLVPGQRLGYLVAVDHVHERGERRAVAGLPLVNDDTYAIAL